MNFSARAYVFATAVAAAALLATLPWTDLRVLGPVGLFGIVAFTCLGILSEAMAVDFTIGPRRTAKSTLTFIPILTAIIVFPSPGGVLVALAVYTAAEILLRERIAWRVTFNVSQLTIASVLASVVYHACYAHKDTFQYASTIAFVAATASLSLTNLIVVSGFVSLRQAQPFSSVFRQVIGPAGGNLVYDLLASPIAIIGAVLYRQYYIPGLLLVILPLLLIRYSYQSKVELQAANRDLLRVLIKAIETRDPYTSGHSVRVSTLARVIATDLGVNRRQLEHVESAALLHDIGKIDSAYAPLISKPFDLSEYERQVIRTHAIRGAELLSSLTSLDEGIIKGVRHHHERYDGTGYPDGLAGEAIPLISRIIMLCDAIDAMLSDRPYRPALSIEEVRDELIRCRGQQFDPRLVDAVLQHGTLQRAAELLTTTAESPELV